MLWQLSFTFEEDADGPLYVYYELENFYQNHRRYVSSRDAFQLEGIVSLLQSAQFDLPRMVSQYHNLPAQLFKQEVSKTDLQTTCESLITNGSLLMNPCGLIANSFFTGTFGHSFLSNICGCWGQFLIHLLWLKATD